MLKQRVITGLVLAISFLTALFALPALGFISLMAVVLAYAAWEWSHLAGLESPAVRGLYMLVVVAIGGALATYLGYEQDILLAEKPRFLLLIACTWWAIAILWVQSYPSSAILWGRRWICLLMGLLVLLPMGLAIAGLMSLAEGPTLVLAVVLLVALADIGGYFVGRAIGRTKLAPKVSPGKTWEGLLGGQLAIIIVVAASAWFMDVELPRLGLWLALAMVTGLASVLGDLLESMIKRQRGVKDSGTILPGHGGVLDRIDGLTAALPVFSLVLSLLYHRL
ncbi:MAG: phosphatidate cytidylyltransferase [Gammaproteobacteria bacterium]|nr:phosphatidate cytidylyltransferase [Gammaproteobacteria bacterium]MBQ0839009.1 phosphatidate cytidylyltransferase [Gammaproteobacteria bacterium]